MPAASSVWRVRPATPADEVRATTFLEELDAGVVARLGRLEDARRAPKLLIEEAGTIAGALTYLVDGDACEVLTLHAATRHRGVGTALLDAIGGVAASHGCTRLWQVTTNDNVDALRFCQRRGFRLVRVDAGAVDRARATIKPSIPSVGEYGIPIRDELLLEKTLPGTGRG
jgi:N-acetylglutamate synthase-like GNAT family acetyltransferase